MTTYSIQFPRSSVLRSGRYNQSSNELTITFQNGSTYGYKDIAPSTFRGLSQADSAGKYFMQHIKPLPFVKFS